MLFSLIYALIYSEMFIFMVMVRCSSRIASIASDLRYSRFLLINVRGAGNTRIEYNDETNRIRIPNASTRYHCNASAGTEVQLAQSRMIVLLLKSFDFSHGAISCLVPGS
jgi:hypothetical protein